MNLDFGQDIIKQVDKVIKKTENYLKSDEVICACYLYKYAETNNLEYYYRYRVIFDNLDESKKLTVARTFLAFVRNKKDKEVNKVIKENDKKLVKK